jgi:hypothetical protein
MNFEQSIKEWVYIDNQLKQAHEKTKGLREKRNELARQITKYVGDNQMDNATIKLGDGNIQFITTKDTQTLTFRYLETCLKEIIRNEEQVVKILDYIKSRRSIKYSMDIKRTYDTQI